MIYSNIEKKEDVYDYYKEYFNKYQPATYNDESLTDLQCSAGRRRGIKDLYKLGKSLYPELTYDKLIEVLLRLREELIFTTSVDSASYLNNKPLLVGYICKDIKKIVFKKSALPNGNYCSSLDENPLIYDLRLYSEYDDFDKYEYDTPYDHYLEYSKKHFGKWNIEYFNKRVNKIMDERKKKDRSVKEISSE
jgi:hypothetical protein